MDRPEPTDQTADQVTQESSPNSETPASWEDLGLSDEAIELIRKAGYQAPTPIQAQTIPLALDGLDVIGSAQTGTGKTASFVLPMVEEIAGRSGTFGLILAPTREIAQQIQATIEIFGTPRGIKSVVLIGGIDLEIDKKALKAYPQIIVATPGRLCDHLDRGNVWLDFIEMVVLDEADRMLNMGFADQLNRIMEEVPENRQTLLFSATFLPSVERLAKKIMYKPERVAIGRPMSAATTVEQKLVWMKEESKNRELRRLIREEPGSIIIFVRSKAGADKLWRSLHSSGVYDATCIHSDRLQSLREQALAEFKEGKYRVLIATDVVGRGIHVDDVAHVVNYDLPLEPEDYVHRIGRTGRKEASGRATSFVTPRDGRLLRDIEKLLGKPVPAEYRDGLEPRGGEASGRSGAQAERGASSGREGGRGGRNRPRGQRGGSERRAESSGAQPASTSPTSSEKPEEKSGSRRRRRRGGRGRRGRGGQGSSGAPTGSAPKSE